MPKSENEVLQSGRIYFFDGLRMLAFAIVVLIHCVQMFAELYQPSVDIGVKAMSDGAAYSVSFVTQWAMALFFLLAGASTWLALRRKTSCQFMLERSWRLLVPLGIGFVLMVPLQAYFEMMSNGQYSGTLIQFYPFFLGNILLHGHLYWIILYIHHLWFLSYLFGFSLIALPLCWYLRSEAGLVWIERLADVCERPGGMLALALPLVLVQIALRAAFPVYCSLADAVSWMLFYVYGYVLFASPRLRSALKQQGKFALGSAIAGCITILVLWKLGLLHAWIYTPDYSLGCLLFQTLASLTLWSWLVVTLAAGVTYLNKNCALLKYGCAASFPWYLVHFPVVMIIAYYILPLRLDALATFLLIGAGSFVITFILTDLLFLRMRGIQTLLKVELHVPELSAQNIHSPARSQQAGRGITGRLDSQALVS